ncbi:MAG: PilZ domain-containing protein [Novosphingobium sp.]|jgi:transcriptional regulator with XRE-family HTH domain|nr:PilZ domain-containing protein [Novosphingobium sp.]
MSINGRMAKGGRAERRELLLETFGELDGGPANVTVHNISETGLLIETAEGLAVGEGFRINLPEAGAVEAEVVWVSGTLHGCRFAEPVERAVLSAAQLRSIVASTTSSASDHPDAPLTPEGTTLGQRIAYARHARHMSLSQVAAALDVSRPTVWAWEHDRARPAGPRMTALVDLLKIEPEALARVGGKEGAFGDLTRLVDKSRQEIAIAGGFKPERVRILIEL